MITVIDRIAKKTLARVVALLGIICYIRLRFETEYGSAITTQVNRTPTTPALFSMPGKLIAELSGPE